MKKIFYALAVVVLFSAASCKKDFTCACTETSNSTGAVITTNYNTTHDTQAAALNKCLNGSNTTTATTTTCVLEDNI